jgi:hypothetical protein
MNKTELFDRRKDFYLTPSAGVDKLMWILGAAGLALLVASSFIHGDGETPAKIWGALLVGNWLFFVIALGGAAFALMQDVVDAQWARPIKRLHESFASFLPVSGGFLIFFLVCVYADILGAQSVYKWIANHDVVDQFFGKRTWLQKDFFVIRSILMIVVTIAISRWHIGLTVARDQAFVDGDSAKATQLGNECRNTLKHWGAPVLLTYAVLFTFLCFDLTMSLSYMWFSTLWGGWGFAVMMHTLMATLLIFMYALKGSNIGSVISRSQFHDVGKLMHGFSIFFAYLTYAHVLTYWYGNMPEETEYFIHRLGQPWLTLICVAPFLTFIIPLYGLLAKKAKWTSKVALPIAAGILVGQCMTYMIVISPEVAGHGHGWYGLAEVGAILLAGSVFWRCVFVFGKKNPMVSVGDPLLLKALNDHH